MPPKLNRERASFVLEKINEILAWEQRKENERDTKFVELGRYLCEVRAGQYWRLEKLKSFDEFLERRFPESRRKAYYLMSIHEHLPPQARKQLKEVGWTKALELTKLARRDGQHFDCATWLHKAREMPKEEFQQEVEKELTGRETEPWEIIYFKLYQSQTPVVEKATRDSSPDARNRQVSRLLSGDDLCRLPGRGQPGQRRPGDLAVFDGEILQVPARRAAAAISIQPGSEELVTGMLPKSPRLRLDPISYKELCRRVMERDSWRCQNCGSRQNLQVHHQQMRSHQGRDEDSNLITLCARCHERVHSSHSEN